MEEWKDGKRKDGKMEGWINGKMEKWKDGKTKEWKVERKDIFEQYP